MSNTKFRFANIVEAGITQAEFAKLVGVSRTTVNYWVNERTHPHAYLANKVSKLLTHIKAATRDKALPLSESVDSERRLKALARVISGYIVQAR